MSALLLPSADERFFLFRVSKFWDYEAHWSTLMSSLYCTQLSWFVQYVGGGSCLAKVQWCEERDRLEAGLKRTSVGQSVVTRSVYRDGFRAERSGGMRRLCVHQPAGGRQNSHATSGRAKEPRILPCVLSQRLPRFLYYRQSGRTSGITERISTRAMLSVFYEWSQARVVRHHRVLGLHPHQWKGQRCQNHSSRGYGWSGGSCDGQPHILGQ